eukprot:sb/3477015/
MYVTCCYVLTPFYKCFLDDAYQFVNIAHILRFFCFPKKGDMLPAGALSKCGKVIELIATKSVTRPSSTVRNFHVFFEPGVAASEQTEEEDDYRAPPLSPAYQLTTPISTDR